MKCRLCNKNEMKKVIEIDNFPKAAQYFIDDINNTTQDKPITLSVFQCSCCGLVQLLNEPVDYYKDVITAASLNDSSKKKLISEWNPIIKKYNLNGRKAVEIGSCRGDFIEVLNSLGFDSIGIESSSVSCDITKKRGLEVIHGYLEDIVNDFKSKYSLVVCNNFLEHQPRTSIFINSMKQLLDEDGILYISVPNLDYLLKKSCLYEFVADHLVYFTEKTLKLALEINGFEVLEQYKKNNDNDLVIIAKKNRSLNISQSKKIVNEITHSLNKCLINAKNNNKSVAVWGAGHRALALMAMANMSYISYVVDSADFKQGKYTPILHKKIINPMDFVKNPTEILILMLPGAYSSQVEAYLHKNNVKCEIILFKDEPIEEIIND